MYGWNAKYNAIVHFNQTWKSIYVPFSPFYLVLALNQTKPKRSSPSNGKDRPEKSMEEKKSMQEEHSALDAPILYFSLVIVYGIYWPFSLVAIKVKIARGNRRISYI